MIHSRLAVLALALVAVTGAAHAQEALKIGTINLDKTFSAYWKTLMSRSQVAEREADFKKIEQDLINDIKLVTEEFARLRQSAQDPANSEAKREADVKKMQEKEGEHRRLTARRAEYNRNAQRTMVDMDNRLTRARMDEIKEVVAALAKEAGYDLVINSAQGNVRASVVYTAGKNDITDKVIAELNKDAPEEYKAKQPPAAEGAVTPADSTAPAPPKK